MSGQKLTKDEFCARFVAYMVEHAGFEKFDDDEEGPGEAVAEYAAATAPTYFEETLGTCDSPEEAAAADMSYWGE
ncbi:hypothetical protein [Bradyrhizobium sp. SZCCHNS3002]|uniref:hypothetical protein n=1 Tax=Bradyrhizobium sp. SZCCHNS3002 TaxID=3057310 RepID=UPI0028EBF4FC|nr:hypothetical protein [Bradyrhizobium sp. SZCCHNS3002]